MSELKITLNSIENAILANGQFVSGYANNNAEITSNNNGAHAEGYVANDSSIISNGLGSIAIGYAVNDSQINASNHGAFAGGYADIGLIIAQGNGSYAYGYADENNIIANGAGAHAEGCANTAKGDGAHAEGINTKAMNHGAHAEGYDTYAIGINSHAEGYQTYADSSFVHAEGYNSFANGAASHIEGYADEEAIESNMNFNHFSGFATICSVQSREYWYNPLEQWLNEGYDTILYNGTYARIINAYLNLEDRSKYIIVLDTSIQYNVNESIKFIINGALGFASHVEGYNNLVLSTASHAEGVNTLAGNRYYEFEEIEDLEFDTINENEPYIVIATADSATADSNTPFININDKIKIDSSNYAIVTEYTMSYNSGNDEWTHYITLNKNVYEHIQWFENNGILKYVKKFFGKASHAEGYNTKALNIAAHAEGYNTTASGDISHAEGYDTKASGSYSHAEGYDTNAPGYCSHTEGSFTTASGYYSHAGGRYTIANQDSMTAIGKFNKTYESTEQKTLFVVGNGTGWSSGYRKNAFEVIDNTQNTARATVNGVQNVELGLPIGSITMWAGTTTPDGWFLCDGTGIPVYDTGSMYKTLACKIQGKEFLDDELHFFVFALLSTNGIANFGRASLKKANGQWIKNGVFSESGTKFTVSEWSDDCLNAQKFYSDPSIIYGTTDITEYVSTYSIFLIPNFQQKFPLGAKVDSSIGKEHLNDASGTWGRYDTSLGETGGESETKLWASESGVPKHTHDIFSSNDTGSGTSGSWQFWLLDSDAGQASGTNSSKNILQNNEKNASNTHNNIPPFLAINFIIKYK